MAAFHVSLDASDADGLRASASGKFSKYSFAESEPNPLQAALGDNYHERVVLLSLENCDWMDTSGIGYLVMEYKRFKAAGGRIVLHSLPKLILDTLRFVHLDSIIPIAVDLDGARTLAKQGTPT